MTARTWRKGPPPFPGWWNARVMSFSGDDRWGWWDGRRWSVFADEGMSASEAAERAKTIGGYGGGTAHVEWSDYYPENARVPRVDPRETVRPGITIRQGDTVEIHVLRTPDQYVMTTPPPKVKRGWIARLCGAIRGGV